MTPRTPLPLTREIGERIGDMLRAGQDLGVFARQWGVTSRHFLLPDKTGWTPLHEAARLGRLPSLARVTGPAQDWFTLADLHAPAGSDATPLHYAAGKGCLPDAAALLGPEAKGLTQAQLNVFTSDLGATPLHEAVATDELASYVAVLRLAGEGLTAAPFLVPERGNPARTPLNVAEKRQRLEKLFAPEHWAGRMTEMMELWRHVSEEGKRQVDFERVLNETALLSRRRVAPELFRAAERAEMPLPTAQGRERERR